MINYISVVICTYNRCESLKDTLDSLLVRECDRSFNYEVIVVDNNSKDKTKEVVESYKSRFNGKLRYIFESKQGLSYARNRGIKEAKGNIIAFTDDDVVADVKWLSNIWECFKKYNCYAVGGRVFPLHLERIPKWIKENKKLFWGLMLMYDYGKDTIVYENDNLFPFVGANMAFNRKCFTENGLFNTDLGVGKGKRGEDSEFFRRLEQAGKRIYYCGKALVYHKIDKKRMSYRYIACWGIAMGRYVVATGKQKIKPNTICYFGFPRYLIRDIAACFLRLGTKISNRQVFLKWWMLAFWNIGQLIEYRRINNA